MNATLTGIRTGRVRLMSLKLGSGMQVIRQHIMTTMRTKPTKELRDSTHSASEADYQALARAVVAQITLRKKDILLSFPYFATFSEGWPKGVLVKKDGLNDVYKVKVAKLADYLYKLGHLPSDYKGIMLAQRDWGYREARLEKMLTSEITIDKNCVDSDKKDPYNGCSGFVEDDKEG